MKQKEVSVLDFNAIDWDMVNQEKAAFILFFAGCFIPVIFSVYLLKPYELMSTT